MDTTIIVAIIGGLATAIPTLITNRNNKNLIMYRLDELAKKVEKHNNVVERMALAERDLKAVWRNIDEIKKDVKK